MTEKEAKIKWCPMANLEDNYRYDNGLKNFCIASDCMMWQETSQHCEGCGHPDACVCKSGSPQWVDNGYCGLTK